MLGYQKNRTPNKESITATLAGGRQQAVRKAGRTPAGDTVAGSIVAIGAHPTSLRRFRREADALLRVRHPGVVRFHEVGLAQGRVFLVMDVWSLMFLGAWKKLGLMS